MKPEQKPVPSPPTVLTGYLKALVEARRRRHQPRRRKWRAVLDDREPRLHQPTVHLPEDDEIDFDESC